MIRDEQEYRLALWRQPEDDQFIRVQRQAFVEAGLTFRPITGWPATDSEINYFKRKRK